jgi:phosphate:Na+ symporter
MFTVFPASPLLAADQTPATISWGFLIIGLLGGLALFLYGMDKMSEGMKKSAGNQMRAILAALTKNRVVPCWWVLL